MTTKEHMEAKIQQLIAKCDRLTRERDDVRREICERISTTRWEPQFPLMSKMQYAEERGWDCFKEEGNKQ